MKTNFCPKNCDLDLTALAAGDLPRWRAFQLRRHLRSCPRCAAAYAEIEALFARMRAVPPAPSVDLRNRTWAQIATEQPARQHTARSPKRRTFALSMAGSAVVAGAVATALLLSPGAPLAPTPAFAMVEKAMEEAQSIEFRLVDTIDEGKSRRRVVDDTYIAQRLSPPTIAMVTAHGESQSFSHLDENAAYTSIGNFWNGKPEFYVTPPQSAAALKKSIRTSMTFKSSQSILGLNCDWGAAQRVRLNGQPALRFDGVERSLRMRDPHYHPWLETLWVNPATLRFLRYDSRQRDDVGGFTQYAVASEFVYDRPDAHSVLTKSPPVNAPIALLGNNFSPAAATESREARAVVEAALSAWKAGDWNRFSAFCEGGDPAWNQPAAPASHQPLDAELPASTWKRLVETRTYQPLSEIKSVKKTAVYTLTRQSEQDRMPGGLPDNVLVARTSNVWFFLKPTSDAGLKIFHITYTGNGPVARPRQRESMGEWP